MFFRSIPTFLILLVSAGGILAAGCGGGDSSPTSPEQTTPTPPPAPTVSVVEVSPNTASIEVGATQRFVATAKASDGAVISGVDFTWSSSNTAVATIDSGGVATGLSVGSATIRATGNGVGSAPIPITVNQAPVSRVTISPSSTQALTVGETVTFTATARTSGGAVRGDVSFTWSSSDTGVVTITSAGVATAVGAGTSSVRATADGIASSPVTINVAEPPPPEPVVAGVSVSPEEASIEEGQAQQFEALAETADGEAVPDVSFVWSSSDEMVATVDEHGLATGVGAGEAMITATADSISGTATLTVTEPPPPAPVVAGVSVSPEEASIEEGQAQQFEAMATTADGDAVPDVAFAWSSSDEMVATVDEHGLATGVGAGEAMITATADSVSGTATLTVTEPPPPAPVVAGVSVSPKEASIEEGQAQQFEAMATTADGDAVPDVAFAWSSSDEMVATVDEHGLATGVGAGEAMITATADSISGTATLTVTEPQPLAPVVSAVTLSPDVASIDVGGTQQFTAAAETADGMVIQDAPISWTSSDDGIATVDSTGLATGLVAGEVIITATSDEVSGTATLSVGEPSSPTPSPPTPSPSPPPQPPPPPPPPPPPQPPPPPVQQIVATVRVSPSDASIPAGQTLQFSATAYDSNDMEITGKTFTWRSGNPLIATINPSTGLATGRSDGSTTVTASADGVSGTAVLTVTEALVGPIRTGTITGRNNFNVSGTVTLGETADGRLKLSISNLNFPYNRDSVFAILYTSDRINWSRRDRRLPPGARNFGQISNANSWSHVFTPKPGESINSYSHLILHFRYANIHFGVASLSN